MAFVAGQRVTSAQLNAIDFTPYIAYSRTTNQTFTTAVTQRVDFNVTGKADTSLFTLATVSGGTQFTCVKAGRWHWIANGGFAGNAGGTIRAWWLQNIGTGARLGMAGSDGPTGFINAFSVSQEVTMAVNDVIAVFGYQDRGGDLSTDISQHPINVTARWMGAA